MFSLHERNIYFHVIYESNCYRLPLKMILHSYEGSWKLSRSSSAKLKERKVIKIITKTQIKNILKMGIFWKYLDTHLLVFDVYHKVDMTWHLQLLSLKHLRPTASESVCNNTFKCQKDQNKYHHPKKQASN